MPYKFDSKVRAACSECGYVGSPWALELHSCDIAQSAGGRCLDFPCCGHVDGDGCQTLPEHTSEYWTQVMYSGQSHLMYEPGSPEYYDALEMDAQYGDGWDEAPYFDSAEECERAGWHRNTGTGTGKPGVYTCDTCGVEYVSEWDEDEDY